MDANKFEKLRLERQFAREKFEKDGTEFARRRLEKLDQKVEQASAELFSGGRPPDPMEMLETAEQEEAADDNEEEVSGPLLYVIR